MNEFDLINTYFKNKIQDPYLEHGIGDDAAVLTIPSDHALLVSTDTLVADVHFLSQWDPYDIAWRSVMVNVSDIAAMGGSPGWVSLALTLPQFDQTWLDRFSEGLNAALKQYYITLIGGDTTRGPLSITLTIHGLVPHGKQVLRSGARPGDHIWVSGALGGAALAVKHLDDPPTLQKLNVLNKLLHPKPRLDLNHLLQKFASSAIDISDGLSADLNHICEASHVGACIQAESIPLDPTAKQHYPADALHLALTGGDDYELCFTVPQERNAFFQQALAESNITCYPIGIIEEKVGLRLSDAAGKVKPLKPQGYSHF